MAKPVIYTPPSASKEQQSIPLMAGIGAQRYALMGARNFNPKRNPDGSQSDSKTGDAGAYGPDTAGDPAFGQQDAAFPGPGA